VSNQLGAATSTVTTYVGAVLGEARLKRFLVAPRGAEVTGITETADGKTIFVNIQHPGEGTTSSFWSGTAPAQSTWPGNGGGLSAAYGPAGRPRSATLVISRADGKRIGEA